MKLADILHEVAINNTKGWGAVPYNADVDYFGLRVLMKPSTFLALALPLSEPVSKDSIVKHIQNGGEIGAPFLEVVIPEQWENGDITTPAKIAGHEGRNRMLAIQEVEGDAPTEVHIFPRGGLRSRDISQEMINHLNSGVYKERSSQLLKGPLFNISQRL